MVKVIYSQKHKDWIRLPPHSEHGIYIDGFLWNTFYDAKKIMKRKDVDLPIAVSGYPGTGKSTIVIQIASICDPAFNHRRMYQCAEDFIEGVKNAKKGEAHVLDESYKDLNSSEIRKEIGRALMNVMNIIRQKRLYIFILLPNFFDLHKSIAVFRTRWLLHCYSPTFGDIGYFTAFDRDTKQQLYIRGKRFEDYDVVQSDFHGTFMKKVPPNFDWEAYERIKEEGLQNVFISSQEDRSAVTQRNFLMYHLYKDHNYTTKKLSDLSGISLRHIQTIIQKEKKLESLKLVLI